MMFDLFVYDNPVLAGLLLFAAMYYSFLIFNRILRSINIALRGWPPAHLDADGDWREEKKKEEGGSEEKEK